MDALLLGIRQCGKQLSPVRGGDRFIGQTVEVRAQVKEDVVGGGRLTPGTTTVTSYVLGNVFGKDVDEHGLEVVVR